MNPATHREIFYIAASHAALPGHFPGNPIVPGVVLLDRVAAVVERVWGFHIAGLPQVKFLRSLLPDQEAELIIVHAGKNIRFSIVYAGATVANGNIEVAA
jgi:3-hydroxyacyl-[acyl-carrier-protein] dehydratase